VSVAAIRTAAVALLVAVSGTRNVYEEEPHGLDKETAIAQRTAEGRVHFWLVKVDELPPAGGVGYVELRHRITVEGFLGLSREEPADEVKSDVTAAKLLSAVVSKFAAGASGTVGGTALGIESVTPQPIRLASVMVGPEKHPVHHLVVTFTTIEDA
jgi:hypothetical protein